MPEGTRYTGDDPDGYALAVNLARRSLSKGQKAMVVARACLVSKQTQRDAAKQAGVNAGRVGVAKTVLDHAPDLADAVVAGALGLDDAYATAREPKTDAVSDAAKMTDLREQRPDLADQVTEERLTLGAALAAMREDEQQRESELRACAPVAVGGTTVPIANGPPTLPSRVGGLVAAEPPSRGA